jgi:hypothetical protein
VCAIIITKKHATVSANKKAASLIRSHKKYFKKSNLGSLRKTLWLKSDFWCGASSVVDPDPHLKAMWIHNTGC